MIAFLVIFFTLLVLWGTFGNGSSTQELLDGLCERIGTGIVFLLKSVGIIVGGCIVVALLLLFPGFMGTLLLVVIGGYWLNKAFDWFGDVQAAARKINGKD